MQVVMFQVAILALATVSKNMVFNVRNPIFLYFMERYFFRFSWGLMTIVLRMVKDPYWTLFAWI